LHCFKLAEHWALNTLAEGDDQIVGRIMSRLTGPRALGREQKVAVRKQLSETFMREIWHDAREILDFLANLNP
jgi:hypothetical protein